MEISEILESFLKGMGQDDLREIILQLYDEGPVKGGDFKVTDDQRMRLGVLGLTSHNLADEYDVSPITKVFLDKLHEGDQHVGERIMKALDGEFDG